MSIDDNFRVLHIASGDLWAGAEVQLGTLACELRAQQLCRVDVILLNHGRLERELRNCGIEVTVIDESEHGGFALLGRLVSAIRLSRPDIVHTHRIKENILGSIACLLAGRPRCLRTVHGAAEHPAPWYKPRRLLVMADRLCGRWLQHAIIAVTADLAKELRADFPARRLHVIENGIDAAIADELPRRDAGRDSFDIGIAGRLVPVKRVDLFLECAKLLIAGNPGRNLGFHVYGDGPLADELQAAGRSLGIDDAVSFHGHCDDIHAAIAGLDVLMITSDHEGLPMILLESMLLETAVVAHAVGGIPAVLEDGHCGTLVPGHDARAYADAVQHCIDAPGAVAASTARAGQRVREVYSSSANARATHRLYASLAGS